MSRSGHPLKLVSYLPAHCLSYLDDDNEDDNEDDNVTQETIEEYDFDKDGKLNTAEYHQVMVQVVL